jgi:BirA family biotin operon repressor/biotin-[acetyl-CoA-carboxylase] ligase
MDEGYDVTTIRGRGYQLISPIDLLDQSVIMDQLDTVLASRVSLKVLDNVDSTNAEVLRRISESPGKAPIVIADCQTAGRGRRGKSWRSPRGENLYLSIGLTFHGGFSVLDGLSLVLGVATAEALERLGVPKIGLKWPNDIFLSSGKLGGILVELQGELQEGLVQVVAGIGINVHMVQATGVDQPWSSLAKDCPGANWTRNRIAGEIISAVFKAADIFSSKGFGVFRGLWQQRDTYYGQLVHARNGDLNGKGCGIDDKGNYLVRTSHGEVVPVRAGEISLRAIS